MVRSACVKGVGRDDQYAALGLPDFFNPALKSAAFTLLIVGTVGGLIIGATPGLSPTMAVALMKAGGSPMNIMTREEVQKIWAERQEYLSELLQEL